MSLHVVLGSDAVARPDHNGEATEDRKQDSDLHGPRLCSHSKCVSPCHRVVPLGCAELFGFPVSLVSNSVFHHSSAIKLLSAILKWLHTHTHTVTVRLCSDRQQKSNFLACLTQILLVFVVWTEK